MRFLNSFSDSSKSSGDPDMAVSFGGARMLLFVREAVCDNHETNVDTRPT